MENSKGGGQAEAGPTLQQACGVILALAEAVEKRMDKASYAKKGPDFTAWMAGCAFLAKAASAPAPSEPLETSLGVDADLPDFNAVTQCNVVAGAWDFFQRMKAEFPGTAKAASAETYLRRTFATLKADIAALPRRAAPPKAASAVGEPRTECIHGIGLCTGSCDKQKRAGEGERTEA